ncbi:MAG: histidine kinase [Bacteroidales bacterium]|jgi:sensor histidine kinase YesM|nr:histidine kinase [Bacteroidales bacterium]
MHSPQNKIVRIALHLLFWLCAWFFFFFYYKRYSKVNSYTLVASIINLVVALATVYTFNYYLIPKILLKNQRTKFMAFAFVAMVMFFYIQLLLTLFLVVKLLYAEQRLFPEMIDVMMLFFNLFFVVFVAVAIKFYQWWSEKDYREQKVQKEKVETELQMLKTQINPHFLFNTLNSIYVLAMKKSEQTANIVMKLSDILDYILYRINTPKIALSNEIRIIKNYIELEKVRFAERVDLSFVSNIPSKELYIPPMLIIPFVENAFKHGVAKSMERSWIKIVIGEAGDMLDIVVSNSKTQHSEKNKPGGIGLENVRKRLDLLFHDRYRLAIREQSNRYDLFLSIPIHQNSKHDTMPDRR